MFRLNNPPQWTLLLDKRPFVRVMGQIWRAFKSQPSSWLFSSLRNPMVHIVYSRIEMTFLTLKYHKTVMARLSYLKMRISEHQLRIYQGIWDAANPIHVIPTRFCLQTSGYASIKEGYRKMKMKKSSTLKGWLSLRKRFQGFDMVYQLLIGKHFP